ncbi:MAG: 1-(5-phosphoribosyl)-5-[(5-phosphoribosylamino)methylideneamino] imidazole-4-carboxamide isomerase [Candidatus Diapherotrites archaeon]|nr:1-(5-phosphoribosyl)-5-[(5-phosphoribosylamino)methylideneamino] imidazole-4-carboxamide isomerase [Candidatus Diapherotrites archaeon]
MKVIPAIDIMDGKAVRLVQGDPNKKRVYGEPAEVAEAFAECVDLVHVVDLDGAFEGRPVNTGTIKKLSGIVRVQVGGGIRSEKALAEILECAAKAVVSTWVPKELSRVVVSLDVRDGVVFTRGWKERTDVDVVECARRLESRGCKELIVTDIDSDGTLEGPNMELIKRVVRSVEVPVTIAGGISCLGDIRKIKETGAAAVIIGKALYEKKFGLEEAIESAR